jgi:hypothetical protein
MSLQTNSPVVVSHESVRDPNHRGSSGLTTVEPSIQQDISAGRVTSGGYIIWPATDLSAGTGEP